MGIKLLFGFIKANWPFLVSVAAIVLLIVAWNYFWHRPEIWNGTAKYYRTHASKLGVDSTRWHRDSLGLLVVVGRKDSIIASQDTTIHKLSAEIKEAQKYASEYESLYKSQVAVSDATVDRLGDKEGELAYYKALLKNGTLRPIGDIASLSPSQPSVVKAGLKTAVREELATSTLSAVQVSLGTYRAANDRLSGGLRQASAGFASLSKAAQDSKKGGIWPINIKRRKQAKRFAASADSAKREIDKISDLERELLKQ